MLSKEEFENWVKKAHKFHTKPAPGIAIGVAMVDYALDLLGETKGKINAVSESQFCLPDVIQLMTGCTIGNRYLKVYPQMGKFALALYDRDSGEGVRVWLNIAQIKEDETPELYKFFHRKRDKKTQTDVNARRKSGEKIMEEFISQGRKLFSYERIKMKTYGKPPIYGAKICVKCNESFVTENENDNLCLYCSGKLKYYDKL